MQRVFWGDFPVKILSGFFNFHKGPKSRMDKQCKNKYLLGNNRKAFFHICSLYIQDTGQSTVYPYQRIFRDFPVKLLSWFIFIYMQDLPCSFLVEIRVNTLPGKCPFPGGERVFYPPGENQTSEQKMAKGEK